MFFTAAAFTKTSVVSGKSPALEDWHLEVRLHAMGWKKAESDPLSTVISKENQKSHPKAEVVQGVLSTTSVAPHAPDSGGAS